MAKIRTSRCWNRLSGRVGARIGLAILLLAPAMVAPTPAWAQRAVGDQIQAADKAAAAGKDDEAVKLYSKAIRAGKLSKPDLARTFLRRGRSQAAKGAQARAVADYTNALWLEALSNDDTARALAARGLARQSLKQGKAALGDLAQAIAKAPNLPEVYINRGAVLVARGQAAKGIADFDKAISLGGGEVYRAYYQKGLAQMAMGQRDAARASFSQSLTARPGFTAAQGKLAELGGGGAVPVARTAAQPAGAPGAQSPNLLSQIFGNTGTTTTTPAPHPNQAPVAGRASPGNPIRITGNPQIATPPPAPAPAPESRSFIDRLIGGSSVTDGAQTDASPPPTTIVTLGSNPTRLNARRSAGVPQNHTPQPSGTNLLRQILGPSGTAAPAPASPAAPNQSGKQDALLTQILGNNDTPTPRRKPGASVASANTPPAPSAPIVLRTPAAPAPPVRQQNTSLFGRLFGTQPSPPPRPTPTRITPATALPRAPAPANNTAAGVWTTQVASGAQPTVRSAGQAPPPPQPKPQIRVAQLEWNQSTTVVRAPLPPVVQAAPAAPLPVRRAEPPHRDTPAPKAQAVKTPAAPVRTASRQTGPVDSFGGGVGIAARAVSSTVAGWLSGDTDTPPPPSARKRAPTRVASIPKSKPRQVAKKPKPTAKPKARRRPPAKVAVKDREGGYVVQVSAQKSLAAARGIAKRVSARHGDLFGAAKPYIIKAVISGKGTFYRVRVGPYRRQQQVASLCASLKGRGQACFTTKTN